jgi:hypothetical protein
MPKDKNNRKKTSREAARQRRRQAMELFPETRK